MSLILVVCQRISDHCQNKNSILLDTNVLIHYMQYLSENKYNPPKYRFILNDFRNLINTIRNQCSFGSLLTSEMVHNHEYRGTFLYEVQYLNSLAAHFQEQFLQIIETDLSIKTVNNNALRDLRPIADNFSNRRNLSRIGDNDLSLLLTALEELLTHRSWKFLIVTNDDSFRKFVAYIKSLNSLLLTHINYQTFEVNSVTLLTFLTSLFTCCLFNDLLGFKTILYNIETSGREERVKKRKQIEYREWKNKIYNTAKSKKISLGVCS